MTLILMDEKKYIIQKHIFTAAYSFTAFDLNFMVIILYCH